MRLTKRAVALLLVICVLFSSFLLAAAVKSGEINPISDGFLFSSDPYFAYVEDAEFRIGGKDLKIGNWGVVLQQMYGPLGEPPLADAAYDLVVSLNDGLFVLLFVMIVLQFLHKKDGRKRTLHQI